MEALGDRMSHIQFHYYEDPKERQRVLTLACRKVEQDKFEVAYAVNYVKRSIKESKDLQVRDGLNFITCIREEVLSCDAFNKQTARELLLKRFVSKENTLIVDVKDTIMGSVFKAIINDTNAPKVVRRIIQDKYKNHNIYKKSNSELFDWDYEVAE